MIATLFPSGLKLGCPDLGPSGTCYTMTQHFCASSWLKHPAYSQRNLVQINSLNRSCRNQDGPGASHRIRHGGFVMCISSALTDQYPREKASTYACSFLHICFRALPHDTPQVVRSPDKLRARTSRFFVFLLTPLYPPSGFHVRCISRSWIETHISPVTYTGHNSTNGHTYGTKHLQVQANPTISQYKASEILTIFNS